MPTEALAGWEAGDIVDLLTTVRHVQPDILIGVSGQGGLFTEEIVREAASHVKRPIIMSLSNPTSKTEVTPENALEWTAGRAILATGSPFPDVLYDGTRRKIGQANNVFIFPGFGLGIVASRASMVTTGMFVAAARTLATFVTDDLLAMDCIYPDIDDVRAVSRAVAVAVAHQAVTDGVAAPIDDVDELVDRSMWQPEYVAYRPA